MCDDLVDENSDEAVQISREITDLISTAPCLAFFFCSVIADSLNLPIASVKDLSLFERLILSSASFLFWKDTLDCPQRDFACIIYSNKADKPIIVKKDEVAPQKIIDVAERFHNGGTNFECALEEALTLLNDSSFKEGDIVFITDGC